MDDDLTVFLSCDPTIYDAWTVLLSFQSSPDNTSSTIAWLVQDDNGKCMKYFRRISYVI